MSWILWALIAWYVLSAVVVVNAVGKPRKPLTSETAAICVLTYLVFIAALVFVAVHV